jgi:hypothetical protein
MSFILFVSLSTEYTQSGNRCFLKRVGGACPHPFTIIAIIYKVVMYAPAEWALGRYTHPVSYLPIYVLCVFLIIDQFRISINVV